MMSAMTSHDIMNTQEMVELVQLLRQKGDEILSATSKLSLSTKLLHNLNEAFSLIVIESEDLDSSFHVCNSSKIDIFRNIKFLHDFVQKTIGLKVTYCPFDPKVIVDISKFKHLKYLELKKVSIDLLKGLQSIRDQLESIMCTGNKGVSTIKQLLVKCGGDTAVESVWISLKHLILSHNALECLDKSLELASWLQTLDLSHNMIANTKEISCLSNLKYVNLGYNKLAKVPMFNKTALHSLQVLVLKNNFIDNLNGLQSLECLTELDLSYNCLMNHSILWPLEKMSTLLWVSLKGNPLSYHSKHRMLCIKHLHSSLSNNEFVLDHLPLSKFEKALIAKNQVSTMYTDQSVSLSSIPANNICESETSQQTTLVSLEKSIVKNKRKLNMKEAIIAEIDQEREEFKKQSDIITSSYLESKDYLETKNRILALREKYGEDNWLKSHSGNSVQDIMGLQSTSQPNEQFSDENESQEVANHWENILQNEEILLDEPMTNTSTFDLNEEAGDLYTVQKKKTENEMEDVFLIITSEEIKERDIITGKLKYNWSMNSVLSCILGRSDPLTVDIIFDTTRKDRENRRYFAEPEDAKTIVTTITKWIEMRPILLKVFKCMKCSTQFSQDADYSTLAMKSTSAKQLKCPTCDSSLVIEIETSLNMDNQIIKNSQPVENIAKINLQHSESFSSIGGMKSGAKSITTSLVHSDSHTQAQVCCSAMSLEESRESTPSANTMTKKYESDIEILSNPSQSSIEVLDETQKTNNTPSRKLSTEEKRTTIVPSLITIPDTTPIMTGLTESSSSGSLTDSICTAYENKMIKSMNIDTKFHNSEDERETTSSAKNLTSILGGLLQSIKSGSNKVLKGEEPSNFLPIGSNVQYSYTDFSSVDHRIKLHLILNVFEHENEELVLLLRAEILMQSMQETFPGCLVLSTSKVYVLRIDGPEGEDPQRWLHKEVSWTMDRLKSFISLPFKQGVLIELQQPGKIGEEHLVITLLCILQDLQRTSNFLFYITNLQLPPNCEVEFSIPEHCNILMHNLLTTTANYQVEDSVRLLAIFSFAVLKYQNITTKLKLTGLILTSSALVILEDNLQWFIPNSNRVPIAVREQAMSNLIAIEHCNTSLTLNFLDEVAGLEETWTLEFISSDAVEAVINSIQSPWEALFSIPLQITTCAVQEKAS